jgi:uncharacterized Fe-S cluster-containing radical SAM superfamily protein
LCVRVAHLFLGTNADNIADRMQKGRSSHKGAAGVRNRTAKLSDDHVRQIRALCQDATLTCGQIGAMFGVGKSAIRHIRHGRNWKHVA